MLGASNLILIVTALTTALVGGLFYSFSCSVTIGLSKLSDAGYLRSMQLINKAILNPIFFSSFFGSLLLLPLCTFLFYGDTLSLRFYFLLAASMTYSIGGFGVTVFGNIPLNRALANFDIDKASAEAISCQRIAFETPWNSLNRIRTIACACTILFVSIACLSNC